MFRLSHDGTMARCSRIAPGLEYSVPRYVCTVGIYLIRTQHMDTDENKKTDTALGNNLKQPEKNTGRYVLMVKLCSYIHTGLLARDYGYAASRGFFSFLLSLCCSHTICV